MNVLKKVLIFLFATLVVIVLISFLLPGRVHVERSTTINAPPEKVYEPVATLKTWKDWTAWNPTAYPNMKWDYKGPESGVGAESMWEDPSGKGHLTVTKADPQTGIEYDLSFDGAKPIPGFIKFTPEGNNTKVVWSFDNDSGWNPMSRYFCFFLLDSLVGKDFETGLANLKKTVETTPTEDKPPMSTPAGEKSAQAGTPTEKPADAATPAPAKQD